MSKERPIISVLEINWLEEFARKVKAEKDPEVIERELSYFLEYYLPFNFDLTYAGTIWRARICPSPEGYNNIKDLFHPPINLTKPGRLNEEKKPIFYASFHKLTIFKEINVKEGDFVQVAGFKFKSEKMIKSCIVGETFNIHLSGMSSISQVIKNGIKRALESMPHGAGLSFVYMDAFLASILSDDNAHETNYMHSRILTKLLLNSVENLDAIFYPSVVLPNTMNIGIVANRVHELLQFTNTSIVKINKIYDYGIYDYELVTNAKGHSFDGEILWK